MSMLLKKIENEVDEQYPLLLLSESNDADWQTKPVAKSVIPKSLPDTAGQSDPVQARKAVHGATENDRRTTGEYLYRLLSSGDVGAEWSAARKPGTTTILDIAPKELRL